MGEGDNSPGGEYLGWSLRIIETQSNAPWSYEWEVSKGKKVCRDPTSHRSKDAAELHGKLAIESLQTQRLTMTQETKIEPRSRALALELMGVLADVEAGGEFDSVCYDTVKRVMEELIAQDVTADDSADGPLSKKQIAAYIRVIPSLEARLSTLQGRSQQSLEAVKTLQSERDANATLTKEVARLTAEGSMPESVPGLVKRLRSAVVDEYKGVITLDEIANEAADALEAAYGVTSKDKQC